MTLLNRNSWTAFLDITNKLKLIKFAVLTPIQDFGRIVKFYNRIATALVKFESLWLGLWKSRIDSSMGGLKTSLLVQHSETRQLIVNANGRLFTVVWSFSLYM